MPRAGLDPQKRPCWLVQAAVFCSARPQLHSSRELAEEAAEAAVPMARLAGSHALEKAAYLKPVRREEKYLRSSLQALHEPTPQGGLCVANARQTSGCRPCVSSHLDVRFHMANFWLQALPALIVGQIQAQHVVYCSMCTGAAQSLMCQVGTGRQGNVCCASSPQWVMVQRLSMKQILQPPVKPATACLADKRLLTSAEGYLNRYRNGWAASAAAVKAWVDEAVRRRGKPVGGQAPVPLNELPVPVPISRFLWPFVRPHPHITQLRSGLCLAP